MIFGGLLIEIFFKKIFKINIIKLLFVLVFLSTPVKFGKMQREYSPENESL